MNLENNFKQKIESLGLTRRYWVGFSGGLDSSVLLNLLTSLKLSRPIVAIHVNHQLSQDADVWQLHCEKVCKHLGVQLISESVKVEPSGEGLESAARQQRYQVFEKYIKQEDVLMMGHHLDDQIETMLFRLMRGTGPKGLAGIAAARGLGDGQIIRPLLSNTKNELLEYAKQKRITWIEDDSNGDNKFDRNYLRNAVIPLLEQRWPNFSSRWLQTAESCREENNLCQTLAEQDLIRCKERPARWGSSINFQAFKELNRERRNNLLRNWVEKRAYSQLEIKHLTEIDKQFFNAASKQPEFNWGNGSLRRYKQQLYLTPLDPVCADLGKHREPLSWDTSETLSLPDGGELSVKPDVNYSVVHGTPLTVRWRSGGERCKPQGRGHSQTVKKLLQEYGLEPWLRDRVPLIYKGNDLIAVGDLWHCDLDSSTAETNNLNFIWCFTN